LGVTTGSRYEFASQVAEAFPEVVDGTGTGSGEFGEPLTSEEFVGAWSLIHLRSPL
jgi:hypothetical protein